MPQEHKRAKSYVRKQRANNSVARREAWMLSYAQNNNLKQIFLEGAAPMLNTHLHNFRDFKPLNFKQIKNPFKTHVGKMNLDYSDEPSISNFM